MIFKGKSEIWIQGRPLVDIMSDIKQMFPQPSELDGQEVEFPWYDENALILTFNSPAWEVHFSQMLELSFSEAGVQSGRISLERYNGDTFIFRHSSQVIA